MAYKYLNNDGLKAYTKKVKGALKDLHTPIAISRENTTESKAQNVRNIADFVAKAKAAGIADVNGMAVTCLIDDDYSAVGYLYGITFIGITLYDDNRLFYAYINENGRYDQKAIIIKNETNQVTSSMLTEGARKPIILTPETTEVDEETYQKLLSNNVDVVFKASDGEYCALTYKEDETFYFTCLSAEGNNMGNIYIYAYAVNIAMTSPHTCIITPLYETQNLDGLIETAFIHKSTLSPVLQEIDLTGTDAERKAKLDKFEADWKSLTGASDLTGARFVGKIQYDQREYVYCGIFVWLPITNNYYAIMSKGSDGGSDSSPVVATVDPSNGAIYIDYLFSHLESVEIFTDNSAVSKQKNLDNLNAYKANLEKLGVDISKSFQVPIYRKSNSGVEESGFLIYSNLPHVHKPYSGLFLTVDETSFSIFGISSTGEFIEQTHYATLEDVQQANTEMLDAVKYSYTPVPLTATTSTNKTQLDLFLSKVPNAQVMHCTYKGVYAGTLHKINESWYSVLVGESNTLAGQLSIKLQADGTIVEGTA